ncbi:Helix-turn-helix [Robiginitalea myxolifaciens]|uniref:Helix-turn-helix n=1 Tax=Robiginitalea myxolifaciens TaxID=400055 RepID=A0A1I6GVX4_9FLAO|nr:helix-turn-helix transcriptional regulator [Robiginitalea myxolifaciens]SFR46413.1 Helix-turn-helix [Robiginitalea myxolifaciens]
MVNSKEFAARLEKMLDFYELSASAFARAIGIQPSGISHLISGRNKPSLDFVMKVNSVYQEVSLEWLLYGKGSFPSTKADTDVKSVAPTPVKDNLVETALAEARIQSEQPTKTSSAKAASVISKSVSRIIICYTDGTFEMLHQDLA